MFKSAWWKTVEVRRSVPAGLPKRMNRWWGSSCWDLFTFPFFLSLSSFPLFLPYLPLSFFIPFFVPYSKVQNSILLEKESFHSVAYRFLLLYCELNLESGAMLIAICVEVSFLHSENGNWFLIRRQTCAKPWKRITIFRVLSQAASHTMWIHIASHNSLRWALSSPFCRCGNKDLENGGLPIVL